MKKRQTGEFSIDHECLILDALYSGHIQDLGIQDSKQLLIGLIDRATEHYRACCKTHFKNKSSTYMRDYFHSFAPHWIAGWLYENDRKSFNLLPKGYGIV